MIDTMRQQMIDIADKFCEVYGITRYDLFKSNKHKGGKVKKVVNGVNVSMIRMALAYYLSNNFPVTLTEVAGLIGYRDHSTISFNNKNVYFYIKNYDSRFMYYYTILREIGNLYPVINGIRISNRNTLILK